MQKTKVGILNLGCPRNLVDAENVLGRLRNKGCKITNIQKADLAIVNTCAFIEEAKRESIEAILELIELKKEGSLKRLIVSGCLSQRYKDVLRKEFPEVDAFVGTPELNHSLERFAITPAHYAYLKICESCVNQCSFCVIPKIKGRFRSLEFDSVLKRAEALDKEKISELNIIGQDITGYGIDLYGKKKLPQLLQGILKKAKHIGWLRLLYLYPDKTIVDLLDIIKDEPKICKYIDLPLQHINDRILKLMKRRTVKKDIFRLIEKIRKKIPDIGLRTSLIVGFPSESEKEFDELLEFVRQTEFDRLGAFVYSREEGTDAYGFKNQVPEKIKQRRFDAVMSLQQQVSCRINKKFLGKTIRVLIDEKAKGHYLARTQYDAPEVDGLVYVKAPADKLKPGDFIDVKITGTMEYDLAGEMTR